MASCCEVARCDAQEALGEDFVAASSLNSLLFNASLCINCGMCSTVCPQRVFAPGEHVVELVRPDVCMECGACQLNCPTGAIMVNNGVGCAAAMISAALRGQEEPTCGKDTCATC